MQIEKYLKKYQPTIYQTFVNAITTKKLSHAYLLVGNPGTPLLETAIYLSKSILCDDPSPLACNNCITCLRIDDGNYQDFILVDGSKKNITRKDIDMIQERFQSKAFEKKNIMIYILNMVENINEKAINSILKFLEEPECEIYAFLTTNNENNILPTIISRCQTFHLKQVNQQDVINNAIDIGVEKSDAEILSFLYNDGELIYEFINSEDKSDYEFFKKIKNKILTFFDKLDGKENKESIFIYQNEIIPMITTKESCRLFFDIMIAFYQEALKKQNGDNTILTSYDKILESLIIKLSHIDKSLVELLKQRGLINMNVIISLLLDHTLFEIL